MLSNMVTFAWLYQLCRQLAQLHHDISISLSFMKISHVFLQISLFSKSESQTSQFDHFSHAFEYDVLFLIFYGL